MFFEFSNFSNGPHWDYAIIEADDEDIAKDILNQELSKDTEFGFWGTNPEDEWNMKVVEGPIRFVLGAGCR